MKTLSAKPETVKRDWYVVDAAGKTLGRLSTEIARRLRGKHNHTGFPGGIKSISFEKLVDKAPEQVIQKSVKGMLPKGPLGRAMFKKLKIYAGAEHPHTAQQPKELDI